jgi:hypothetical protein
VTPRRSNSASIASQTISAGMTARPVQRMITARVAIGYSVMEALLSCNPLHVMLYRIADQLRTILFTPDPFRRLLRSSVRSARKFFVFQFLPANADHSKGHDDAGRLDGMAFALAWPLSN